MSSISCEFCSAEFNTKSSLYSHRARKHHQDKCDARTMCKICRRYYVDIKQHQYRNHPSKIPIFRPEKEEEVTVVVAPRRRGVPATNFELWRRCVTLDHLKALDNLEPLTDEVVIREIVGELTTNARSADVYNRALHVMCQDMTYLLEINIVDKLFAFHCECFCNLLERSLTAKGIEAKFKELCTTRRAEWHFHAIVLLKKPLPSQTVRNHFAAALRGSRTVFKIKNYRHYVDEVLYVMGRLSRRGIPTHAFHSGGFFLSEETISYIKSQCDDY